jgi:uncharacterized protein YecE (DUF72 family)
MSWTMQNGAQSIRDVVARWLHTMTPALHVGCAGWALAVDKQPHFPEEGSHLTRYAARLPAVEINSSFYRPHLASTYARWAASVPASFRFSVKVPKTITHVQRLAGTEALLDSFLAGVTSLGTRLGCLLVQLPPSLAFDPPAAEAFFAALRQRHAGAVVAEPRHSTWFTPLAEQMLVAFRVGRVAADPPLAPAGGEPGGWPGTVYYRLHGSPRVYYSDYDAAYLDALAARLAALARAEAPVWCIFDNTALGAATLNALDLIEKLRDLDPAAAATRAAAREEP